MKFGDANSSRYAEEFGIDIITVNCRTCKNPIGDYFADDVYPEYCDYCDPDQGWDDEEEYRG